MQITIGSYTIDLQIAPIHGASIGVIYYDPQLEDESYPQDDMYYKLQFLLGLACLHITWWRWIQ